ncbi:MAG: MerR family transcriptional regulator [Eubacteriales bacterium]|nr:MerR family transcriptional regulator [Eubacteriales bacterium]
MEAPDTAKTYTTKQIAGLTHIHVNTVRLYERIGFITAPKRQQNGYRVYTDLQLAQCRLVRLAMRAEVLQNGLRDKAVEIVRHCAALDMKAAIAAAQAYQNAIRREIASAKAAIAAVEKQLNNAAAEDAALLKRQDAAQALGVTAETLRTWERSGLIKIKRSANGYRVYAGEDMERLNIIRTLRCANYSLSAILRLLNRLDASAAGSVEAILNTPESNEDIVSACDRLIVSLENTASDAEQILEMLLKIHQIHKTLQ